ncbi:MAG TPA: tetratricopeptide repeat protein [Albitalea sp.]|uniref:tetratricopeptide repeat protein n=1 Tax=Piscinibacter sp. TaxID=1903157 RepID=UPI002ED0DBCC
MPIRSLALVVLCAAVAGCATVNDSLKTVKEAVVDPVAKVIAPAPAASSAAPAPAAPVAAVEPQTPVSPTAQRDFDNAVRLMRSGRVDEAERGFRALAKSNPELGGPHANLGVILRQQNKLPEAVAEFELAVKASPSQPVFHNQLGVAYRQNGQFAKAREAYEKAIALDPNYPAAQLNLGILHDLYLNDGPRALELYGRYLALSPSGDATVTKWIADLKNRKAPPVQVSRKEKE